MTKKIIIFLSSCLLSLYVLGPLVWMVSSSFQPENEITSKPPHWIALNPTMENFRVIFTSEKQEVTYENRKQGDTATGGFIPSTAKYLLPSMWNSFVIGITVVILNLLISTPAAYAMAKIRFIGRSTSVYFMLATRVIPDIALVVPFFLFIQKLGLMDSKLSLMITYLSITIPFSVFILVSYFESLPDELDKAARIDGCSRWQSLVYIYLTLAVPSLIAVSMFTFLTSWNEFLLALMFTQTEKSQTMPIIVASFASDFNISFSFINAAGVMAIIPPVVLAMIFQKYIASGLTAGAVKG